MEQQSTPGDNKSASVLIIWQIILRPAHSDLKSIQKRITEKNLSVMEVWILCPLTIHAAENWEQATIGHMILCWR